MSTCRWLGRIAAVTLILGLPESASATLFAVNGADFGQSMTSSLYTVDPLTGNCTLVGDIGFRVVGMAFDPITGKLYGSTATKETPNAGSLILIDPLTGQGSLLPNPSMGSFGFPTGGTLTDIAFDSKGNLYGWGSVNVGGGLFQVTLDGFRAGEAVLVGEQDSTVIAAGLAFRNDTLFMIGTSADIYLYTLDLMTGEKTEIASLSNPPTAHVHAMVFDQNGTLFGANFLRNDESFLLRIDPATGDFVNVGQMVNGVVGLAYRADGQPPNPVIPEPASFLLMCLGFIGIVARYCKRREQPAAPKAVWQI